MKELLIRTFTETEISFYKDKSNKADKIADEAWTMDISPEAYFERSVEEIAKDRINFEEKLEELNRLDKEFRAITNMDNLLNKIDEKIADSNKYNDWIRKAVLKRYKKYLIKNLDQ